MEEKKKLVETLVLISRRKVIFDWVIVNEVIIICDDFSINYMNGFMVFYNVCENIAMIKFEDVKKIKFMNDLDVKAEVKYE